MSEEALDRKKAFDNIIKKKLKNKLAEKEVPKREINMHYIAVENITKDDYVYIHYDGKVFNGNEYPFALRDGVAKRDIWVGQYVSYDEGNETSDLSVKPIMPSIEEAFGR